MRVSDFSPTANNELMTKQLDLLEEHREMATIRLANYQQKMAQRYDKGVRSREFNVGNLVLHRALGNARDLSDGKLALNLGGVIQSYCNYWSRGILLGRSERETTSPTMECVVLKKILPLNMLNFEECCT